MSTKYLSYDAWKLATPWDDEDETEEVKESSINLYLGYDNLGFEDAKRNSSDAPIDSLTEYNSIFTYLVEWASQDLDSGFCDSFQIYNQDGEIIYQASHNKEAA